MIIKGCAWKKASSDYLRLMFRSQTFIWQKVLVTPCFFRWPLDSRESVRDVILICRKSIERGIIFSPPLLSRLAQIPRSSRLANKARVKQAMYVNLPKSPRIPKLVNVTLCWIWKIDFGAWRSRKSVCTIFFCPVLLSRISNSFC